ncbi:hypothetical protein J1614_007768 [Plenodomus biglobosus]|nr:hypothetical protein J1614_007768 [Plenodomus biglobosus]
MIVWPNWHGIFDASTHQRIKSGVDVPGSELLLALPTQPLVSPAEIPLPVTPEGGVEGDDKYFGEPGPMVLTAVEDEEADKDDGSNALDHSDTTNDNDSNASDASAETAYYSAESE